MDFEIWHLTGNPGEVGSWADVVKRSSLHLVLNQKGEGLMMDAGTRLTLLPATAGLFTTGSKAGLMSATRFASDAGHNFVILVIAIESVERVFGPVELIMKKNLGILRRWSERESGFLGDLVSPPIQSAVEKAWYLAKTLEILSLHLFRQPKEEPSFFCSMIKSNAHRHVREALMLLEGRLEQALDLKKLARDVGCAPPYLSRLVKQETGKTLLLHLRSLRISKAAEMLSENRLNVTEVALEVGYQSLSHFSKAFSMEQGMTPSQFLKRSS